MPLIGAHCDDDDNLYSFDECLACAIAGGPRRCHNPLPLIVAMSKNSEERADAGVSATMLLDCPRKVILAGEVDYHERPSAYWARFRGTIGHLMMEAYGQGYQHIVQEVRRRKSVVVDGVTFEITGKPDWIDLDRKLIIDFKSIKSINAKPVNQGEAKEGHRDQVSIYRWLCAGGVNMVSGEVEWVDIERAGILYFDMTGTRKIAVELLSLEETEQLIIDRIRPIVAYRTNKVMPPFLQGYGGNRSPLCNYCPVREECDLRGE